MKPTFWSFLRESWNNYRDLCNMTSYMREQWSALKTCDPMPMPSKLLRKRYGFDPSGRSAIIFAILEEYFASKEKA